MIAPPDFAILVLAFLLGAIPTGFMVGKIFFHQDVRQHGSGNIGATNVGRTLGRKAGIYTLLGDLLKGVIGAALGYLAFSGQEKTAAFLIVGFCAVLGHCFSPFLRFKGGKGVATAGGVFLFATPLLLPVLLAIFGLTLKLSKYVSLASIVTALSVLPLLIASNNFANTNYTTTSLLAAGAIAAVLVFRHQSNILRLLKGQEFKFVKS